MGLTKLGNIALQKIQILLKSNSSNWTIKNLHTSNNNQCSQICVFSPIIRYLYLSSLYCSIRPQRAENTNKPEKEKVECKITENIPNPFNSIHFTLLMKRLKVMNAEFDRLWSPHHDNILHVNDFNITLLTIPSNKTKRNCLRRYNLRLKTIYESRTLTLRSQKRDNCGRRRRCCFIFRFISYCLNLHVVRLTWQLTPSILMWWKERNRRGGGKRESWRAQDRKRKANR